MTCPRTGTDHGEHLRDPHELDARAAGRSAECALVLVDRLPTAPRDEPGYPRPHPRLVGALRRLRQPAAGEVVEQRRDGVGRALLVRADHARRASLDPADGVLAAPGRAVLLAHPAAGVADQAAPLVERDARERATAVADRADHEPARDDLVLARGRRAH